MKLRLKYFCNVRADKKGEYPDALAKRLIASGLAVEDKTDKKGKK